MLFIGTTVVCGACARQRHIETADVLTARRDADAAKVQMVTKKLIVDLVEHVAAKQKDFADGKSKIPATVDVLVVSGGGDWGAFGADISRVGTRFLRDRCPCQSLMW